jgi:hypothetical protein
LRICDTGRTLLAHLISSRYPQSFSFSLLSFEASCPNASPRNPSMAPTNKDRLIISVPLLSHCPAESDRKSEDKR